MSEVITFDCTGCGMPYRVASSYAGRDFTCKKCGTRLAVPQPGQSVGYQVDPNVELDSGGEVMRRTTPSGRQVRTDPTRVFAKQRETSARMAAVGGTPEEGQKKSSKAPLIAVVGVVVLLGIGLAAAFALGAFNTNGSTGNDAVADGNTATTPVQTADSERQRILKQIDVSGQTAAQFLELLKQGEDAKLEGPDLALIGKKAVAALLEEEGAGYSDAELLSFAGRMDKLNAISEAKNLYMLVVKRNRGKPEKSDEYLTARKLLGDTLLDFGAQITRGTELQDSGVVPAAKALNEELLAMESRADEGWAGAADTARFGEIVKLLDEGAAEYERIKATDPFRLTVAKARARFGLEKASSIGNWITISVEPYVIFCQQQDDESEADTRRRIQSALDAAEVFPGFFEEEILKPLKLTRSLPSDLPEAERDGTAFEVLLFRSASYWKPYLKAHDIRDVDPATISTVTEPGSGRISMVYENEAESLGKFLRMMVDCHLYNYHPNAPKTRAEDEEFVAYQSYWLNSYWAAALSFTSRSGSTGKFSFFTNDPRPRALLKRLRLPYAISATTGRIDSFGGPAFTARQIVGLTKLEEAAAITRANFESYGGWESTYLDIVTNSTNTASLLRSYMHALILFTYFGDGDDHPYREKLMKFIRMDLDGEVDRDAPLPAFEKAFGLDEDGWQKFEADFTAWQTAD